MAMDDLFYTQAITANDIPGLSVYGLQQVNYTVDGKEGLDFGTAAAIASLQQTESVEHASAAYSEMVRLRMRKLEDLSLALSIIAKAIASLPAKGGGSDDLSHSDIELKTAEALLKKHEISSLDLVIETDKNGNETSWQVSREAALMRKNEVQYILDTEDNTLQQDMIALQSLVSKRDNSFSTAAKLLNKINGTAQTIIGNVGG